MLFRDRAEAGQALGSHLKETANWENAIVLALPRGGVPVGFEVVRMLNVPLDVFVVRKLGVPWQPELAMGAIATGGTRVLNDGVIRALGITNQQIETVVQAEQRELEQRERQYRGDREPLDARGRTAILVDDGLATGSTMLAAIAAVREARPDQVVVAVPVAPPSACEELELKADRTVCLYTPQGFSAVGQWYRDFSQTTDEEVHKLLERAARELHTHAA